MARQERFLPPEEFWSNVNTMITPESGSVAVVLPLDRVKAWETIAEGKGFKLRRRCWIRGNQEADISRAMLEWTYGAEIIVEETEVVIEDQRGVLNQSYLHFAHSFLLEK
jgi:tRNA1(Val) A37 N6-methylase TrmN6